MTRSNVDDARRGAFGPWWLTELVLPLAAIAVGIAWLHASDLEARALDPFYDASAQTFPLRRHWLYDDVLHVGGKYCVIAAAAGLCIVAVFGGKVERWRAWRGAAAYVVLCLGLTIGLAGALKSLSDQITPWNLDRYGGSVPTETVLGPLAPWYRRYGSPAAHAASGFAWIALYFVARARGVRRPVLWAIPSVVLGSVFAWTQHVRGAHFPSHNLWTIAIAWTVAVLLARWFVRRGWLGGWRTPHRPGSSRNAT